MFNNVTTRSNVFAVWVTVGFFEVYNADTANPTPGAEIGRAEGRHIRHRLFALVDRTNLEVFSTTLGGNAIAVPSGGTNPGSVTAAVPLQGVTAAQYSANAITGTNPHTGCPWQITGSTQVSPGTKLVFSPGTSNEETVTVTSVNAGMGGGPPSITATFTRNHAAGARVCIRGNPGPWNRYDHRADPYVVLYYNIID
jgi:hypothetical protein